MKNISRNLVVAALAALFIVAGTGRSLAHYDHDHDGWYDEHHHHHPFVYYHNHCGYWDHDNNGVAIFIRI